MALRRIVRTIVWFFVVVPSNLAAVAWFMVYFGVPWPASLILGCIIYAGLCPGVLAAVIAREWWCVAAMYVMFATVVIVGKATTNSCAPLLNVFVAVPAGLASFGLVEFLARQFCANSE